MNKIIQLLRDNIHELIDFKVLSIILKSCFTTIIFVAILVGVKKILIIYENIFGHYWLIDYIEYFHEGYCLIFFLAYCLFELLGYFRNK